MLAQTISWIDLFRPLMVLIENVQGMDPKGSTDKKIKSSAAGQAIAVLVSMGYQARLVTIRASDHGGSTSRQRIFIVAAAPGIPLPQIPQASHGASKGRLPLVTASSVTTNLPKIGNETYLNPMHPDHVPLIHLEPFMQQIVEKISVSLKNKHNNLSTVRPFLKTKKEKEFYDNHTDEQRAKSSGAYCRVNPNEPMGTIVTSIHPRDARGSRKLHWFQHRVCSFEEYRRFHGVPDWYIIVGNQAQQMRQLGNSVAWATSNVLGRAYAEA